MKKKAEPPPKDVHVKAGDFGVAFTKVIPSNIHWAHSLLTREENANRFFQRVHISGTLYSLLGHLQGSEYCEGYYLFTCGEEVVIHEFASLCLVNMSAESTSKVKILENGGLKPLIRLLSSPDPDVKKNSVEYVYNLVQDFQCGAMVQELNAIPSVLKLLKSEYSVIQLLALKTLDVITNDKDSQAMLRDSQGIDHLIKILETKESNDLHIEALSVIASCLVDRILRC